MNVFLMLTIEIGMPRLFLKQKIQIFNVFDIFLVKFQVIEFLHTTSNQKDTVYRILTSSCHQQIDILSQSLILSTRGNHLETH